MENKIEVPAIGYILPELLPFLNALSKVYTPEDLCRLQKLTADISEILTRDNTACNNWSLLTPGGFPMEFTFRCDTADLYLTTETGPENSEIPARLKSARQYSGSFRFGQYPALAQFSKAAGQRYGCWLGIRTKEDKNVYKLYHEVTPASAPFFLEQLLSVTGQSTILTGLIPMMAGFTPGLEGIGEFYCRIGKPSVYYLDELFSIAGVAPELGMLLDYLCWIGGTGRKQLLTQIRFGVSFQPLPGKPPAITIFVHAAQLCRRNIEMRSRLINFARHLGYRMELYELVTDRLLTDDPAFPVHGMISLRPQPKKNMLFTIGVRPW